MLIIFWVCKKQIIVLLASFQFYVIVLTGSNAFWYDNIINCVAVDYHMYLKEQLAKELTSPGSNEAKYLRYNISTHR